MRDLREWTQNCSILCFNWPCLHFWCDSKLYIYIYIYVNTYTLIYYYIYNCDTMFCHQIFWHKYYIDMDEIQLFIFIIFIYTKKKKIKTKLNVITIHSAIFQKPSLNLFSCIENTKKKVKLRDYRLLSIWT